MLRQCVNYNMGSSLPFLSGLGYGVFIATWDYPLWMQVRAGLALVVLGPFVIQFVLTLIVDALRGVPDEPGTRPRLTRDPKPRSRGRPPSLQRHRKKAAGRSP